MPGAGHAAFWQWRIAGALLPRPQGEIRNPHPVLQHYGRYAGDAEQQTLLTQERLRALTHQLQSMRVRKNGARIAQELHDELGRGTQRSAFELERLIRRAQDGYSHRACRCLDGSPRGVW